VRGDELVALGDAGRAERDAVSEDSLESLSNCKFLHSSLRRQRSLRQRK
jgi:hypothetical protein